MKTLNEYWAILAERYPFLIDVLVKARTFTLPGFDKIPVYDVYRFFIAEIRANSMPTRSKSIAFSFFLAIFPALTFIFSLIPYLPYFSHLDITILNFLEQILPNQETYAFIKSFLEPLLKDMARHKRGGLLTGSIVVTLFLTSNGVLAMMSSFDKSYAHYKKRNALMSRWVAIKITMLLILLFIISLVMIVGGQSLLTMLLHKFEITSKTTRFLLDIMRYVFIILTFFFGISLIYYYGPATKNKYKFISTGATVATLLSLLVSVGFSYWVSNFNKLNVIFGSIGTIMLLLIWCNINAFVLLIGYEINASIHYNKSLRMKELEVKEDDEKTDTAKY